jgi:hypothetical protein
LISPLRKQGCFRSSQGHLPYKDLRNYPSGFSRVLTKLSITLLTI